MWTTLASLSFIVLVLAYQVVMMTGEIELAKARLKALESGLACGPESKQFDGLAGLESRMAEAGNLTVAAIEEIRGRIETIDLQLGKVAPMGAHSDLCERVAKLDRGLQSLADEHAEESAATSKALAGVKDRLFDLDCRVASLRSFREALHRASDPTNLHPEGDPE